ncbi:MAG: hypothetical protein JJE04_08330 [Acidobacteriia bacterium]|nr:hypothetical protein [Terriglobia bacterium]
MMKRILIPMVLAAAAAGQKPVEFEQRPALALDSGKMEVIVMTQGGAFTSMLLKDDGEKMNPLWNPIRAARETGGPQRFGSSLGHFVCVDGFGPTSKQEAAAGLQGHGEAHRQKWEIVSSGKQGNKLVVQFRTTLPLVQEVFTRKLELVDGEQVLYVDSEVESLLAFDRPINWAEHGTIGSPFLVPEQTVVDASVGRCQTRPNNAQPPHRLASEKEFTYPMAPLASGEPVSIRAVPAAPNSMDHTGCVMDPAREHVFVTALRLDKKLLFGYLFKREEYPWLQEWMNYTKAGDLARGLEFGTQPFDVSRRQTVEMGNLFGVPAFRWLPAKSKIGTRFLMFYTQVPDGFTKVDDVRLSNGTLIIEDKKAGKQVKLAASLPL